MLPDEAVVNDVVSNDANDLSMVDAFNQTQSLIMDSYLRQNFNINEYAKEMKRKQE